MFFKISGLVGMVWADILAGYALWMMMIYLTDVWKLKMTYATGIINVFLGLIGILPFALQFLVDTFVGNFWMLIVSSLSYCVGMGILTMSTPPVLAHILETCSDYEAECIGNIHRILFYTAIVLIAVGISGHSVCVASFMIEQPNFTLSIIEFNGRSLLTMLGGGWLTIIFTTTTAFALSYIKLWSLRFGIPAIFMVVATLLFLTMSASYTRGTPEGSPLLVLLRVLVASASKFFIQRPTDINRYHGIPEYALLVDGIPPLRCFRCLEKGAIILPHQTLEQQLQNKWSLCTLTEVRNAQHIIFMIPAAMAFILWGLVSSLPYTYFIEQAKNMNHKVGSLTVPITILLWLYALGRRYLPKFACELCKAPVYGVVMSMIFGVICCITAASVESRRLDVVKKHGLLNKPYEEVPMSVFWLVPQFVILGAVDGFMETSTAIILQDKFVFSWWRFMLSSFTSFANGLGCFGSVLGVYVVGKLNESGGKASWFQDTLNESRVDKYYLSLAWLIACNLGLYIVLMFWYNYMMYKEESDRGETQPFCCCCC